jgi:hypothetical protein
MKKILTLLILIALFIPNTAFGAFAVGWNATSTAQGWIWPNLVNGISQKVAAFNFIASFFIATSTTASTFPYASTTAISGTNAYFTKLGNLTSNGFVKTSGSDGTLSVDTTTYESGLTAGDGLTRTTNDFDCDIASGSVFGCLASADWTTFNNKQAAGNYVTALTGDVTASGPGSAAATLATVNGNVGSFTNANITVNAKGLITAASNGTAGSGTIDGTGFAGMMASWVDGDTIQATSTIVGSHLIATSTATSTLPRLQTAGLNNTGFLTFNGVTGSTWASFCTSITGSASLCDGNDATGGGAGGTGTVSTSTNETSGYVPYWTSTSATPATLGSDAGFQYNGTTDLLTVTNASTTAFSALNTVYSALNSDLTTSFNALCFGSDPGVGFYGFPFCLRWDQTNSRLFFNDGNGAPLSIQTNTLYSTGISNSGSIDNLTGRITTLNASSTNFSTVYASATRYFGAGLTDCDDPTNSKLLWSDTGTFSCGTDQAGSGSGGADGNWTFFNGSGISLATTSNQVLIGASATSSDAALQVVGRVSATTTLNNPYINVFRNESTGTGARTTVSVESGTTELMLKAFGENFSGTAEPEGAWAPGSATVDAGPNSDTLNLLIDGAGNGGSINFYTFGHSERYKKATILENGNFGIGTSSPFAKLSVGGSSVGTTDLFAVSTSSALATTTVFKVGANGRTVIGNESVVGPNILEVYGDSKTRRPFSVGLNGHTQINNSLSGSAAAYEAQTLLHITHNNESDYDPLLNLNESSKFPILLHNLASITGSSTGIGFNVSSSVDNNGAAIIFKRTGSQSQGELQFYTKSSTSANVDPEQRLVITNDGNIGIATTSPYAKLSVVGQAVAAYFTATTTATSTLPHLTGSFVSGFGLSSCVGTTNKVTYADGTFRCENDETAGAGVGDIISVGDVSTGAAFDGTQGTILTFFNVGGNSTLDYDGTDLTSSVGLTAPTLDTGQGANELYDMNQNVLTTSNVTFGQATTTSLYVTGITSALLQTDAAGLTAEYAGTSCTNQFIRSLSALGIATCATVGTADVSGLDISDDTNLTAGDNLTLTGDDIDLDATLTGLTAITVTNASTTDFTIAGVVKVPYETLGFSYATTTWTGTTTIMLGPAKGAQTFADVACETDVGTVGVSLYDGTNRANYVPTASTTINTNLYSTNNTFTKNESRRVDIGTPASSPRKLACTFKFTYTDDQ